MNNLEALSPAEKKVAAKELVEAGYSTRTLANLLEADHSTIALWAKQDTPEELRHFSTQFKKEIALMKEQGIGMVHKRLLELIPKERRIDQVVRAGEFLEGKDKPAVQIQNNNFSGVEFVMDDAS